MKASFPPDFLWGASTSAHQVEGGNNNDWAQWERLHADRLAERGKDNPGAKDVQNYMSGQAAQHYERYEEDLDLAAAISLNAYRFSIEWSRVEPKAGTFNKDAIEHYRRVIEAAKDRGLEPVVCLWHWTLPLWLARSGGWSRRATIKKFELFVRHIVRELGDEVRYWVTLNEPEVYAEFVYQNGRWLAQRRNSVVYFWALRNLALAHRSAFRIIKRSNPKAMVGLAKQNIYFEPYRNRWYNKLIATYGNRLWNQKFLDWTHKHSDFIGLNYYFHSRINLWKVQNEDVRVSDMGWELYPDGLYHLLVGLRRYKKPIIILEHGLADATDKHRAWYIRQSLKAVQRAMTKGADVQGYFHWSLIDNFEWDSGFWPRFGLVEVDYVSQRRTIRPSAFVLKRIIDTGEIN